MKVIYAREPLPKSIFLAGPTPRDKDTQSWRPEALRLFEEQGFDGTIMVPEDSNWSPKFTYEDQVKWEWEGLDTATVVLFWIPRELAAMPAFTTNVEYGMMIAKRNVVMGWPEDAPKNRYLEQLAWRYELPGPYHTLLDTVNAAIVATHRLYEP
jgi:hypothetical protein